MWPFKKRVEEQEPPFVPENVTEYSYLIGKRFRGTTGNFELVVTAIYTGHPHYKKVLVSTGFPWWVLTVDDLLDPNQFFEVIPPEKKGWSNDGEKIR